VLTAQVVAQQAVGPPDDWKTQIFRRAARLRYYLGAVLVRERDGGRPGRGASVSRSSGLSVSKRFFHLKTVRSCIPSSMAMSQPGTPSASSSRACPRRKVRFSTFPGLSMTSSRARSSADTSSGTVGQPLCRRPAHGVALIMPKRLYRLPIHGKISDGRN
jgi:hypothetical protein